MHQKYVLRQLVALQLGHLPKPIKRWIVRRLRNATPEEIKARLNRDYAVEATRRAIAAMRRKTALPVVQQRPPAPSQPRGVRHVIVTSPPPPPANEVRARIRHLAKQVERKGWIPMSMVNTATGEITYGVTRHHVSRDCSVQATWQGNAVQMEFPFTTGRKS